VLMCPTLHRDSEGFMRELLRSLECILQIVLCASRSLVNVKVEAHLLVVNDSETAMSVNGLERLLVLKHGVDLTPLPWIVSKPVLIYNT
jgi:hypothetical protein